jgi:hypothetical protein
MMYVVLTHYGYVPPCAFQRLEPVVFSASSKSMLRTKQALYRNHLRDLGCPKGHCHYDAPAKEGEGGRRATMDEGPAGTCGVA